jgi:hypothetical protein
MSMTVTGLPDVKAAWRRRRGRGRRRGLRGRGCRRGFGRRGTLRVIRAIDHVEGDVHLLRGDRHHSAVEQDVDRLLLDHRFDVRPNPDLELVLEGLGLLLRTVAHLLQLGLAVLEEGLSVAGLLDDLLTLLVGGLGRQQAALGVEFVLQRLDGRVQLVEIGLLLRALGIDLVLQVVELLGVALAEQALGRDAFHVHDCDLLGPLGLGGGHRALLGVRGRRGRGQRQCEKVRLCHVCSLEGGADGELERRPRLERIAIGV